MVKSVPDAFEPGNVLLRRGAPDHYGELGQAQFLSQFGDELHLGRIVGPTGEFGEEIALGAPVAAAAGKLAHRKRQRI